MIQFFNGWGSRWLEMTAWAVVQNTLFLGIVFLLLHFLEKTPAKVRYLIAMTGLVKCLIPPFLNAPSFRSVQGLEPGSTISFWSVNQTALASPVGPSMRGISPGLTLEGLLFVLWTITAFSFLATGIIKTLRWKRSLNGRILIEKWNGMSVFKSSAVSVPMTIGFFKPVIYVPDAWGGWSPACRRMILDHELAHIRRLDRVAQLFQMFACALYFYHPLVWLLNGRMDAYREMACDEESVGRRKADTFKYAKTLVGVAESAVMRRLSPFSQSALIREQSQLVNRIHYLMEGVMKPFSSARTALLVCGLLLLIVPFSWTQGGGKATLKDKSQTDTTKNTTFFGSMAGILPDSTDVQKALNYPEAAVKAGLEGKVVVMIVSDNEGLKEAKIAETSFEPGKDLGCEQAALDAVRKLNWSGKKKNRFGEFTLSGTFRIPVVFRLPR
jgi:TonB family protein